MIVNLSGRGDKDVATAAEWFDLLDKDSPEAEIAKEGNSCEHQPGRRQPGAAQHASKSAAAIDRARAQGRAALIGYLPAGYPSVAGHHRRRHRPGRERRRPHRDRHPVLGPGHGRPGHPGGHHGGPREGLPRPGGLRRRPRHHQQDRRRRAGHDLLEPRGPDGRGRVLPPPGRGRGSRAHHARPHPGRGRRMDGRLGQVRPGPGVPGGALVLARTHEAHRRREPRLRLRRLHHGRHRRPDLGQLRGQGRRRRRARRGRRARLRGPRRLQRRPRPRDRRVRRRRDCRHRPRRGHPGRRRGCGSAP